MLFDNMNLFEVIMTSVIFTFVYAAFSLFMINLFERVGEWMSSHRRLVNVITVDENGKVTMRK